MRKKIPLTFKEKHLCILSNHMLGIIAAEFYYLIEQIRAIRKSGTFLPDDLITVDEHPEIVLELLEQLDTKHNFLRSNERLEMKAALQSQIQTLLTHTDPEIVSSAQFLGQKVSEREAILQDWIQGETEDGRASLLR
jgi:hypothetical protein